MAIEEIIATDLATDLGKTYVYAFDLPLETRTGVTIRTFNEQSELNKLKKSSLLVIVQEDDYPTSRDTASSAVAFFEAHRGILESNGSNWSTVGMVQSDDIGPNALNKYVFRVQTTIAY